MSMRVVSASYAPDFDDFARMHESVVAHTPDDVRHLVIVPDAHATLFRTLDSARLDVLAYSDILPRRFVQTAWTSRVPGLPRGFRIAAVNARRPWPPVRGWIMQQAAKLAAVTTLSDDVAILIDSDVVVVRPLLESKFRSGNGTVRLYRKPHGVTTAMTRHLAQRARAMELLGLDRPEPNSPDYISAFVSWDPRIVRACTARIESVTGKAWIDVIAGSLDFSEYITYGTFVMSLADDSQSSFVGDNSLCHSHWGTTPLTPDTAPAFVAALRPDDVAVHVQSNSSTDAAVMRYVIASLQPG